MNTPVIVDASVALKWVVDEPDSDIASALLADMTAGTLTLVAPEHLIGEVSNGLRKRVAQKVLSPEDALTAMDAIAALELEFIGGTHRWFQSLRAALNWQVTSYDALDIQLALDLKAELITADIRLTDSAQGHSLPVRSLSSYDAATNLPEVPQE